MKTTFKNDNGILKGELRLHDLHKTMLKILSFNPYSINNWYPLNSDYDLLYHVEKNVVQLLPVSRKELSYTDYGISVDGMLESDISQGLDNLVIKTVQADNNLVCQTAKDLNLPCWLDVGYSTYEVEQGIKDLCIYIDSTIDRVLKDYYYDLSCDDKVAFKNALLDKQEHIAFAVLSEQDKKIFSSLGKLYTMLSIMRKVAKVNA